MVSAEWRHPYGEIAHGVLNGGPDGRGSVGKEPIRWCQPGQEPRTDPLVMEVRGSPAERVSVTVESGCTVGVWLLLFVCLLFYVLATSKVISGQVPTCDSAHSWRLL